MEDLCVSNTKYSSVRRSDMLRKGHLSDCEFIVNKDEGDDEKGEKSNSVTEPKVFRCHKMILALHSEVFERMLYGEFAEKSNPVRISDISPEVFEILLRYIYFHKIGPKDVTLENILELIYTGEKYLIQDFVDVCMDSIEEKEWPLDKILNVNVYQTYFSSGNPRIIFFCQQKICSSFKNLFDRNYHTSFNNLNINYLEDLVILLAQCTNLNHSQLLVALQRYGSDRKFVENHQLEELSKLYRAASHLKKLSDYEKQHSYILNMIFENIV